MDLPIFFQLNIIRFGTLYTSHDNWIFQVNLDRVEEEMAGDYSEEEEGDILHIGKFYMMITG